MTSVGKFGGSKVFLQRSQLYRVDGLKKLAWLCSGLTRASLISGGHQDLRVKPEYDDSGVASYLAKDKAFSTYFIPDAELFQTGIPGARAACSHLLVEQTEQHGI